MESLFEELRNILETEKNIFIQLLDTAREHNRALRQLNIGVIHATAQKEDELAAALRGCDQQREDICGTLAARINLSPNAVISEFIGRAPVPVKDDLKSLWDDLDRIARELAGINETNGLLAGQAMRINSMMLQIFKPADNRVYTPDGRMREEKQQLIMINKKA
ncbi:MAG: flagellar protein FlgN [Peptococcaceae bacterium]|nr:flagellar protein FlgN [Peptococcaceae bacterium]